MNTYLFYDIETTGLNIAFDQILHFAAIRTDLALNEIARYEIKVKLNPDVIPSPYALITHHMSLRDISNGISEYDAIRKIHEWLNEPGTISVGYNTLGFDDEFLRFSFYRNLLSPYTHQYANGCGRMDIYPMTIMYHLFKNDILGWPQINGEISLKLELLNKHNQFVQGQAHDAMVDVEATLALAKRFYAHKEMWQYNVNCFNKSIDQLRTQKFSYRIEREHTKHFEGLLIDGKFKSSNLFMSPVLYLGTHKVYKQSLWLRLDNVTMETVNAENFKEHTWTINKKWGEPSFLLPTEDRFTSKLQTERLAVTNKNLEILQNNTALLENISNYYTNYIYPEYPNVDADASLYLHGFWNNEETNLCRRFHVLSPTDKFSLLSQITNPKLKTLALRILGKNYFQHLPSEYQNEFNLHLARVNPREETDVMIDFKNRKRLTPRVACEQISELKNRVDLTIQQQDLLSELDNYLRERFVV